MLPLPRGTLLHGRFVDYGYGILHLCYFEITTVYGPQSTTDLLPTWMKWAACKPGVLAAGLAGGTQKAAK